MKLRENTLTLVLHWEVKFPQMIAISDAKYLEGPHTNSSDGGQIDG